MDTHLLFIMDAAGKVISAVPVSAGYRVVEVKKSDKAKIDQLLPKAKELELGDSAGSKETIS